MQLAASGPRVRISILFSFSPFPVDSFLYTHEASGFRKQQLQLQTVIASRLPLHRTPVEQDAHYTRIRRMYCILQDFKHPPDLVQTMPYSMEYFQRN